MHTKIYGQLVDQSTRVCPSDEHLLLSDVMEVNSRYPDLLTTYNIKLRQKTKKSKYNLLSVEKRMIHNSAVIFL